MILKPGQSVDLLKVIRALQIPSNPWQDSILTSPKRHLLLRAARRTGKSHTAAKWALKHIILPNTRGWIVGPSYELAQKEFRYLLDFTRAYCRLVREPEPTFRDSPQSGDLYFRTAWGAECIGKSAAKAETLVGEELDWLIMSEAALHKSETWTRYLRPTLTTRKGQSIWAYTPDAAGLWLYQLEESVRDSQDWAMFTLSAWDCPHYDPTEIEAARRDLGAESDPFAEQFGGEWRFYTGRVYKMVRRDVHLVDPFPIPQSWKIYVGVDFGYRDPTAALWLAKSPTGEGYLIDEYYVREKNLGEHVRSLLELEARRGYRPTVRLADHHGLGTQLILDASRAGFKTNPCQSNDRRARRERAITAFTRKARAAPYHVREFQGADAPEDLYPDAFIFKGRCPHLEEEQRFLRWKETARREGAAGDTEGEDHAIDAIEYVIEYANLGAVARSQRNKRQSQSAYLPAFSRTGY